MVQLSANPVPVRHAEGLLHGFLVLKDMQDNLLASGELSQTVQNSRVTAELLFHFKDGSLYQETVVYSQRHFFRLISYHLVEKGTSFKTPTDWLLDGATGLAKVEATEEDGEQKKFAENLKLPSDVVNGMVTTLLLDIDAGSIRTELSMVVTTPKPRLVKLIVTPSGEETFFVGGAPRKSFCYNVKIDIGGLSGVIAPLVGKQPPDTRIWIIPGKAPGFLKSEGPLFEGGPIWRIELASPDWNKNH